MVIRKKAQTLMHPTEAATQRWLTRFFWLFCFGLVVLLVVAVWCSMLPLAGETTRRPVSEFAEAALST